MDKPVIEAQSGPAPTDLVVEDIVVGDGAEAQPGAVVEVHYVGAEYETNQEFDSSWDRGQSTFIPGMPSCQPAMRPVSGNSMDWPRSHEESNSWLVSYSAPT